MAICHIQNMVPSSALQRERKKTERERLERENEEAAGLGDSAPGEQGEAGAATAASPELRIRDIIPYLQLHRNVTDDESQQLFDQLEPWGVPVFVYHLRNNMRHLETRGKKGFYMRPGSGPSMNRVCLRDGGAGDVKKFTHLLVPPALAHQHAMRMHLCDDCSTPPVRFDKDKSEPAGGAFAMHDQDEGEAVP